MNINNEFALSDGMAHTTHVQKHAYGIIGKMDKMDIYKYLGMVTFYQVFK